MLSKHFLPNYLMFGLASAFLSAVAAEDPEVARLQKLDAICEEARIPYLMAAREEMVEKCITIERRPRATCEAEMSTYGNGQINRYGAAVHKMFLDIPECVAAQKGWEAYQKRLGGQ